MNKTGTQRLETQRLILRRFEIEDADDMYNNWASDPEVTRYLTWPVHSSVEVTRSLLTEWFHYMRTVVILAGLWNIKRQERSSAIFPWSG